MRRGFMIDSDVLDKEDAEDEEAVLPRRPIEPDDEIDMTPMIDCVFQLLIFFLVCSTMQESSMVKLPPARHGTGANEKTAVIITVDGEGGVEKPRIYLGDGTSGPPLPEDHAAQEKLISDAVEAGLAGGKTSILVKAARGVKSGDVERVSKAAAATAEGRKFYLGVMEIH